MNKQTIIIFEGHDQAGKSTIAKALSERLGVPIFKMDRSKYFWDPIVYQKYATEAITQFLEKTNTSVILDRSFPSDKMYSILFSREYNFERHINTDERFGEMNAIIIFCYKDKQKYLHDEEDKDFVTTDDYDRMIQIYLELLQNSACRSIKINTSDENLEAQLATIIKNI